MHRPWRELRRLSNWLLTFTHLPPGVRAECHWPRRLILMGSRLLQAERRSALAHELEHLRRGPFPRRMRPREERAVNAAAARKLIRLHDLGEALAWADHPAEVADELWVDVPTVHARLAGLTDDEPAYLARRLAHRHHDQEDHHGAHP